LVSNAIVIGGGIGGLAVAAALGQSGVVVTLLEQAPAIAEVGAGLQVSPNGLAVLRALGVESALVSRGAVRGRAVVLRNGGDGAQVARLDLARLRKDQPYYFMHRADLVDVLAGAAKRANVSFEMSAQVASIRPGPLPQVQMSDGGTRRAELVVAADGIHSVARPVLNGADKAVFSGQVAWRAAVPNSFGHPDEAHVHMGPGCHLVSYPMRAGRVVNLVAVEEREGWAAEGWNHPGDPLEMKRAFASLGGMAAEMVSAVADVTVWGLHLHPVAEVWEREGVALLGDAAHPTLPFLAQGANMALEDAWVLAKTLAGGGDLAGYQQVRRQRVVRVIKAAEKNAWRYHLRPGVMRSVSHLGLKVMSRVAPGRMIRAFDWLYGVDVTKGAHRR